MKSALSLLLLVLSALLATSSSPVFAAIMGGNDAFVNASFYSGSAQAGSNTFATVEPGEPSHRPGGSATPSHSVWWKFTPPLTGYYQVDTLGSSFDTVLDVYTGTTVTALTRVGFSDDIADNNSASQLSLFLTKGTTYRIAVDGKDSAATGDVTLHVMLLRYCTARTYQAYIGDGGSDLDAGGMVTFTVANSSLVTGKLLLGVRAYPFTAAVDPLGVFSASVVRPGLGSASITGTIPVFGFNIGGMPAACNVGPAACVFKIGFATAHADAYVSPSGDAGLVPYFPAAVPYTAANPCPRAGRYPFTLLVSESIGSGVATLTMGTNGVCTGAGRLGEGTPITFSAPILDGWGNGLTGVSNGGAMIIHVPLYAGKGRISLESGFNATTFPATILGGGLWLRPVPAQGTAFLPLGIQTIITLYGSRYTPPGKGQRLDSAFDPGGALALQISRPGLADLNQSVTLSTANTFTYTTPNTNLVKLSLNTTTGTLTGSVKFPGATTASPVSAVLIHHPGLIKVGFYGYVPGATSYGSVLLGP